MTPSELKVKTMKRLDEVLTSYMDGLISADNLFDEWTETLEEFVQEHGDL